MPQWFSLPPSSIVHLNFRYLSSLSPPFICFIMSTFIQYVDLDIRAADHKLRHSNHLPFKDNFIKSTIYLKVCIPAVKLASSLYGKHLTLYFIASVCTYSPLLRFRTEHFVLGGVLQQKSYGVIKRLQGLLYRLIS